MEKRENLKKTSNGRKTANKTDKAASEWFKLYFRLKNFLMTSGTEEEFLFRKNMCLLQLQSKGLKSYDPIYLNLLEFNYRDMLNSDNNKVNRHDNSYNLSKRTKFYNLNKTKTVKKLALKEIDLANKLPSSSEQIEKEAKQNRLKEFKRRKSMEKFVFKENYLVTNWKKRISNRDGLRIAILKLNHFNNTRSLGKHAFNTTSTSQASNGSKKTVGKVEILDNTPQTKRKSNKNVIYKRRNGFWSIFKKDKSDKNKTTKVKKRRYSFK